MLEPALPSEADVGTLTFSGVGFGGTVTKRYKWYRVGNLVTLAWRLEGTTNVGANFTQVDFVLPSDLPTPGTFSNYSSGEVAYIGTGGATDNFDTRASKSTLSYNGSDWIVRTYTGAASNGTQVMGTIQYMVDGWV